MEGFKWKFYLMCNNTELAIQTSFIGDQMEKKYAIVCQQAGLIANILLFNSNDWFSKHLAEQKCININITDFTHCLYSFIIVAD